MAVKKNWKIWKASKESLTGFMVTPDAAFMIGGSKTFIAADENGIVLKGPISFATSAEQMRTAGIFVGLNDFTRMIPSTMMTPFPQVIPVPPIAQFASIARQMPIMLAMLVV